MLGLLKYKNPVIRKMVLRENESSEKKVIRNELCWDCWNTKTLLYQKWYYGKMGVAKKSNSKWIMLGLLKYKNPVISKNGIHTMVIFMIMILGGVAIVKWGCCLKSKIKRRWCEIEAQPPPPMSLRILAGTAKN